MLRYAAFNDMTPVVDGHEDVCYIIKKVIKIGYHESYVQAEDSEMHNMEDGLCMPYSLNLCMKVIKWLKTSHPENVYAVFRETKTMLCITK